MRLMTVKWRKKGGAEILVRRISATKRIVVTIVIKQKIMDVDLGET